ncbi:MAG: flagellar basal body L-ring protein FlgH [Puniceicoccaceae bacterium]
MKSILYITILAFLCAGSLSAASNGSVWGKKGARASMYADNIAGDIGDIVTIVVQESASISASKSSSTSKESSLSNQIERLIHSSTGELPGLKWSGSNDFEGSGEISNSQSAQSRMSVVVIDKLPNGNLVIEGMRKVTMADEINYAVLRGYIRAEDIRADNSILSTHIADAQIEYVAEGTLTEAQRKGWLNRIYSFLSPF